MMCLLGILPLLFYRYTKPTGNDPVQPSAFSSNTSRGCCFCSNHSLSEFSVCVFDLLSAAICCARLAYGLPHAQIHLNSNCNVSVHFGVFTWLLSWGSLRGFSPAYNGSNAHPELIRLPCSSMAWRIRTGQKLSLSVTVTRGILRRIKYTHPGCSLTKIALAQKGHFSDRSSSGDCSTSEWPFNSGHFSDSMRPCNPIDL
eukprot:Gb_36446 [translate_table: standard]